jgi:hypothetical protein
VLIVATLCFVWWFMRRSQEFAEAMTWAPISNVSRTPLPSSVGNGCEVGGFVTEAEVVAMAKEAGRTKEQGLALFAELDLDGNGVLDFDEYRMGLDEFTESKHKVPYQNATCIEGAVAMFRNPSSEVGRWVVFHGGGGEVPRAKFKWSHLFQAFTPAHIRFYPVNILTQLAIAAALHLLAFNAVAQAAGMCLIEGSSAFFLYRHAPYAFLGDSRSVTISYTMRFATNVLALGISASDGAVSKSTGVPLMVGCQLFAVLQTVLTQLLGVMTQLAPLQEIISGAMAGAMAQTPETVEKAFVTKNAVVRKLVTLGSGGLAVGLVVNLEDIQVDLFPGNISSYSDEEVVAMRASSAGKKARLAAKRAVMEVFLGQAEQLVHNLAEGAVRAYAGAAMETLCAEASPGATVAPEWVVNASGSGLEGVLGASPGCFQAHLVGLEALWYALLRGGQQGSARRDEPGLDLGLVTSAQGGALRAAASGRVVQAAFRASAAPRRQALRRQQEHAVGALVGSKEARPWARLGTKTMVMRAIQAATDRGDVVAAIAGALLATCVEATALLLRDANMARHASTLAALGVFTLDDLGKANDAHIRQSTGMSRLELRIMRKRLGVRGDEGERGVQLEIRRVPSTTQPTQAPQFGDVPCTGRLEQSERRQPNTPRNPIFVESSL